MQEFRGVAAQQDQVNAVVGHKRCEHAREHRRARNVEERTVRGPSRCGELVVLVSASRKDENIEAKVRQNLKPDEMLLLEFLERLAHVSQVRFTVDFAPPQPGDVRSLYRMFEGDVSNHLQVPVREAFRSANVTIERVLQNGYAFAAEHQHPDGFGID